MVIPGLVLVVNEGCPKTPSRVDASTCDGDGGQVNQKHSKPNRQWRQDLNIKSRIVWSLNLQPLIIRNRDA